MLGAVTRTKVWNVAQWKESTSVAMAAVATDSKDVERATCHNEIFKRTSSIDTKVARRRNEETRKRERSPNNRRTTSSHNSRIR